MAAADHWAQFRGNDRDGVSHTTHPDQWTKTDHVSWSIDVPGEGWSCPVVWDDRVFLTAAVPVDSASSGSGAPPEKYTGGGGR